MENVKKTFWSDAAKAGGVLGIAIFVFGVISWLLKIEMNASWAKGTFEFVAIVMTVYYYGNRRAAQHGDAGFSYSQSMGFILAIMLFAGVIVGFGQYLLQQVIAPEYYQQVIDMALVKSGADIDSQAMEQTLEMMQRVMKNPIVMVLSGMLGMLIYGLFIGIIASVFIKRPANIFGQQDNE